MLNFFHWFLILIIFICFTNYSVINSCPPGNFILKGMSSCHPFLNCEEIYELRILNKLTKEGNVKELYLAKWGEYDVVFVKCKNLDFVEDFRNGLKLLKLLSDYKFITNLIGFCDKMNYFIIEFYKNGDARNILKLLSSNDTINKRIELCLNYAEILHYLHDENPVGRLVFCDSNDLMKLLSQLLIDDNMQLIMNDLDALPIIKNNENIICGQRKLYGDFVAPEQRHLPGNNSLLKRYNEKTDIWKVPDVCNYFIKNHEQYNVIIYYLFNIHKMCKNIIPEKRPSALQIINEYRNVLKQLSVHDDL